MIELRDVLLASLHEPVSVVLARVPFARRRSLLNTMRLLEYVAEPVNEGCDVWLTEKGVRRAKELRAKLRGERLEDKGRLVDGGVEP